MKFCKIMKDGGAESVVWGFWLFEIKSLFSIAILKFEDGSRDAYHNHAFDAISWILWGELREQHLDGRTNRLKPSFKPVITPKSCFHKVTSYGNTYALTFRGRWDKTWKEYLPSTKQHVVLSKGRKIEKIYGGAAGGSMTEKVVKRNLCDELLDGVKHMGEHK